MVIESAVTPGPVAPPLLGKGPPGVPGTQGGDHQAMAGSYSRPPTQWDVSPLVTPGGVAAPLAPAAAPAAPPAGPPETPPTPAAAPASPPATPPPPPTPSVANPPPAPLATAVPFWAVEGAVTMMISCTASANASGA